MTDTGRGIATSIVAAFSTPVAPGVPSAPSWYGIQAIKKKADKEP